MTECLKNVFGDKAYNFKNDYQKQFLNFRSFPGLIKFAI
jgi:hypothetical protein